GGDYAVRLRGTLSIRALYFAPCGLAGDTCRRSCKCKMRVLRISLRNIASLAGTQTIDFTRDPLRTTGLFSISGSTGSGKSTVLDALCLALYERTPRLDAVRGATKLPDGSELVSQSDPSNLLRRGSGEGFAEVAFVGVD